MLCNGIIKNGTTYPSAKKHIILLSHYKPKEFSIPKDNWY